jgi:hypothetical protein
MDNSPGIGVGIHAAGGITRSSFSAPLKRVRTWACWRAWAGGLLVNFVWCLFLGLRNRSVGDFVGRWHGAAGEKHQAVGIIGRNYLWAGLAGATCYVGFMLYGMGTTFMGKYDVTSWSIHLAFVIMLSTICGNLAREWRGVSRHAAWLVAAVMLVLVGSTFVIAVGNRWANRTIGDKQPTAANARTVECLPGFRFGQELETGRFTCSTSDPDEQQSPLLPTGLLGSVPHLTQFSETIT